MAVTSCLPGERRPPFGAHLRLGRGLVLRGPVEFDDSERADFGDRLLHLGRLLAGRLLRVLAGANLAFDLDVRALGQRRGVLAELAPGNAAVPGGLRLILARFAILPTALGGQRQDGECGVALGAADFGILAEESDESGSILVHNGSP
jgi:hypothetical protein